MSVTPVLPLEILMLICKEVAIVGDNATLKTLSLLHSSLTLVCQQYLFSNVVISSRNRESIRMLQQTLETNPRFGSYVRSLYVSMDHDDTSLCDLRSTLETCTQVNDLAITFGGLIHDWPEGIPKKTLAAFESIIHQPALTELSIHGFNLPVVDLLSPCQGQLATLCLYTERVGFTSRPVGPIAPFRTLKHLHINLLATDAILEAKCHNGQHFFDLSHLTSFKVDLRGTNIGDLISVKILLTRAINLKKLAFEVDYYLWSITGLFDDSIACLSTMTSLEFDLSPDDTDLDRFFQAVLSEIRHLPPRNALESVHFNIGLSEDLHRTIVPKHWLRLATNFTLDAFPHLKEVTADVHTWAASDWCSDDEDSALAISGEGWLNQDTRSRPLHDLSKIPFDDLDLHFNFIFSPTRMKF